MEYPKYPDRSQFILPIEEAITESREALLAGEEPIVVRFSSQGYSGNVRVTISEGDDINFEADFHGERFPRRIRAAAFALFRTGCFGTFIVSHDPSSGAVTIERA